MRRRPISFRWMAVRVALCSWLTVAGVAASEDLERARAVFREALVLEVAGDWAAALTKFQEVGRTRLTPQVRYHLARCKEHLGRLTEALGDYRVSEVEARAAQLVEIGEIERARRDLEARIPTLLLRGGPVASTFQIELDGITLGPAVLNQSMVLNPGQHQITLRNPKGASRTSLVVAEEGKRIEVDLRLYDENLVPQAIDAVGGSTRETQGKAPTWAYVALGSGTAAVAASVVLFIVRAQAKKDLEQHCTGLYCPENMRSVQTRGEAASIAAPLALGIGLAGIGLGTWGILGSRRDAAVARGGVSGSTLSAVVWPAGLGVNLAAKF